MNSTTFDSRRLPEWARRELSADIIGFISDGYKYHGAVLGSTNENSIYMFFNSSNRRFIKIYVSKTSVIITKNGRKIKHLKPRLESSPVREP